MEFVKLQFEMVRHMIWAFVDYENVGSLEGLKLADYERLFVFCGPKNSKIKLGTLPAGQFCRIELIGISTMGANNLDFHMAFHLGRLHQFAEANVEFHIVSEDTGFTGLIAHLKKLGRKCRHVSTRPAKPVNKPPSHLPEKLSAEASAVMARLKKTPDLSRPRKQEKLLNWMKGQCSGMLNGKSPADIYGELVESRFVKVSDKAIDYATA